MRNAFVVEVKVPGERLLPRMRARILLVALLTLGGCVGPTATDSPESGRQGTSPSAVLDAFEGECFGFDAFIQVPSRNVAPFLPEGYVANGADFGIAGLDLRLLSCSRMTHENVTEADFGLAMAYVPLSRAGGFENPDRAGGDRYILEIFLETGKAPLLAGILRTYGFPVQDAKVAVTDSQAEVVSNSTHYTVKVQAVEAPFYYNSNSRFHFVGDFPAYFDETTPEGSGRGGTTIMNARGGVWSQIAPAPVGPSQMGLDRIYGELQFHRPN